MDPVCPGCDGAREACPDVSAGPSGSKSYTFRLPMGTGFSLQIRATVRTGTGPDATPD